MGPINTGYYMRQQDILASDIGVGHRKGSGLEAAVFSGSGSESVFIPKFEFQNFNSIVYQLMIRAA
jgi:hypothetical protein